MESSKTNKNLEKTENQDELSPCCQNQKFLQIENYVFLSSKSAVLISFIQKDDYRKCFKLLSETFLIEFSNFQDKNSEIQLQSQIQLSELSLQSQSLGEMLCYNEKQDFRKSFNGFTRRINQVLFILVFRNKNNPNNNMPNDDDGQLRFLFLNNQGRIMHVLSNVAPGAVEKLSKMIIKFFRRLQNVYVFDFSSDFQESSIIFQELQCPKITKALIYISPFSRELLALSKKTNVFPHSQILALKYQTLQKSISNLAGLVLCQNEHEISELERNIEKTLRYQQIHYFITQKAFQPLLLTKISQKTLFTNQWLNNTIAWYFNIIQSFGQQLSLEKSPKQALKAISSKIATYFEKKIYQNLSSDQHYNSNTQKCFPDLLTATKVCIVCKRRKPKYGCLKCSNKYDMGINLCIEQCFKNFHKNHIKYLPKHIQTNESSNPEEKSTSMLDAGFFVDQTEGKTQKKRQLESDARVEKNCKSHHPFQRYKMIRKKLKKAQKKTLCDIKLMRFRGVELIDFSGMECTDENEAEFLEQMVEINSKKIDSSQNSSKIEEEESYQMDPQQDQNLL